MSPLQLKQYLDKISLALPGVENGKVTTEFVADSVSLALLQKAQHQAIPFENFDVFAGGVISLKQEARFEKLVSHPRGGYCFEVNGLFLDVLTELGFQAEPKLARVHLGDTPSGRSHQVTLVTIDEERWIVDVGFGSHTSRAPIKLVVDVEQHADFQLFRFVEVEDFGYLLQRRNEERWIDLYSLDMAFAWQGDIEYANHYTSTSVNTVFTQSLTAALATQEGSVTLLDRVLRCRVGEEEVSVIELEEHEYFAVIARELGIEVGAPQQAAILKRLFNKSI